MTALLALLGLVVALVGSLTPPTQGARTPSQAMAALRRAGWGRCAWWALVAAVGAVGVVAYAIARGYGWVALLALAALIARLATLAAMDGRPIRVHRTAGGRA